MTVSGISLHVAKVYDMRHVAHRTIDAAAVVDASFDDL